jgi:hypothetical protein
MTVPPVESVAGVGVGSTYTKAAPVGPLGAGFSRRHRIAGGDRLTAR